MDHCYTSFGSKKDKLNFLGINVCGLFSKLKFGVFQDIIEDYDFICVPETKILNIPADVEDFGTEAEGRKFARHHRLKR